MRKAIVKLGFCIFFFCAALVAKAAAPPTVTVTRVTSSPTNAGTVQFTVTFSTSVNGFTNADVVLTNDSGTPTTGATTISVSPASPAAVYTVDISNINSGTFTVSIPAAAATDASPPNTANLASSGGTPQIVIDKTGPVATITDPGPDPTTGASTISFNVTFNEPINPATLIGSAISFSTSDAGLISSLSVGQINEQAPMNNTVYQIVVNVAPGASNGNLHAKITIPGTVTDVLGNVNTQTLTDNDVTYAGILPTSALPTATSTDTDFNIVGNVTASGGRNVTDRGTVWSLTSPVGISDHFSSDGTTGTGSFNMTRSSSVTAHTKFYFATYATNAVGTKLSPQSFIWTLDSPPTASGNMSSANATSGSTIDLAFTAFGANASGLVIIRKTGGSGWASSDLLMGKAPTAQPGYVATITDNTATSYTDSGLTPSTQYTYSVIPFNVFSAQDSTTNYKTTFNTKSATTITALSRIVQNNAPAATLAYATKPSMTIDATSKGLTLADLTLLDGNGPADDPDNKDTNVNTITIHVTNSSYIGHIALVTGSTILSEGTLDGSGNITFTTPSSGSLQATDDDNNGTNFKIIANFVTTVTDGAVIELTITGATVRPGSSAFFSPSAGGYDTGGTANAIDVIATKFVFSGVPASTNPNTDWGFTATLEDDNNNVDTNLGGNVTLSEATLSGTLTKALSSGVVTFSALQFSSAGSKSVTLDASNWAGATNGTLNITCISLGVQIFGPNNQQFCFNNSSTSPTTFSTLDPIRIKETDRADFGSGTNQTYTLQLPTGFIFDTGTAPTFVKFGNEVSLPVFVNFPNNNQLRFKYDVSGTTNATLDSIRITGLKVKYTDVVAVSNAMIFRIGGSAVQDKNADTDNVSHGTLKSVGGSIGVTFQNTGPNPSQTAFSHTSTAVGLQGQKSSDLSILTGSNAVFSGEGVAFDGANYNFNPSTISNGNHTVTFTYTDPVAPNCVSTASKVYSVFSSLITGLNPTYCINDTPSSLGNPTTPAPVIGGCNYQDSNHQYYFWDLTFSGNVVISSAWNPAMDQFTFDPGSSTWAEEVAYFGGVYIRATYTEPFCGEYDLGFVFVTVNALPIVSFSPAFPNGVCATDAPYDMTGSPYTPANGFDEFWSSAPGFPGTGANGITGDRASGFKFQPQLANITSSDKIVQINYRHKDLNTGCVNTAFAAVNVWAKPAKLNATDIIFNGTPTVDAKICHKGNLDPFSTAVVTNVVHSWHHAVRGDIEGEVFAPVANDFTNTAGVPNIGAVANYGVSQIVHRVPGFSGCASDPLALTATIMQPTIVTVAASTRICEGNPVVLADITPGISSPDVGINGTWTSNSSVVGTFYDGGNPANSDNTFLGAVTYQPSPDEFAAKVFILTLKSDDPSGPCGPTSADVTVSVNPGIVISFPQSPVLACADVALPVTAKLSSDVAVTWTFDNASHGTILPADATQLTTIYRPSQDEIDHGKKVVLTIESADPDGSGPCTTVSANVDLFISQRPLIVIDPDFSICTDSLQAKTVPLKVTPDPVGSSAFSYSWVNLTTGSNGTITNAAAATTTYNPSTDLSDPNVENPGVVSGQFTKVLTFQVTASVDPTVPSLPAQPNVCGPQTKTLTVTVHGTPVKPVVDVSDFKYCIGDGIALLKTNVPSPAWYDDISGSNPTPFSTSASVSSGVLSDHEQQKVPFWLTQTFDGCESWFTPITITVNPNPVAAFDYAHQCFGEIMQFTDKSTIVDPFGTGRTIASYEWAFDDGTATSPGAANVAIPNGLFKNTSGTYNNPGHKYDDIKKYNVRLNVTTTDGCKGSLVATPPIEVGPIPVVDFTTLRLCDQDNTEFTSISGLPVGVTATYSWDFDDATTSATQNPIHQFGGVGSYDVTLIAKTALNCADTITRKVSILPYIKSFPYVETFESPNHGWVAEGTVSNGSTTTSQTSWNLLTSAGSITSDPGLGAGPTFWATHTNVAPGVFYYDNERSVLYGPCVDMTHLTRPVIAMDYFVDTENKGDGAYIEYKDESANINAPWTRLGDSNSGLNWYNDNSIGGLSALGGIGQTLSQFGWDSPAPTVTPVPVEWTTGRYNLDALANSTRLRFRIVFGSNTSPVNTDVYDGFAIDYFKLETRNRLVLVESFTSKSSTKAITDNSDAFKVFPSISGSSEVVKIEYHTGLPATAGDDVDPIFTQNPMDPNARASLYGLSAVPRGYIDGASDPTGTGSLSGSWAVPYYSKESLKTSPLDITINTPIITNGTMNIKGTVLAKEFGLPANTFSLYIAVVEQAVGSDAFVLRKMLPSASGRKVPLTVKGGIFTFDESWSIDKSYLSSNNPQLIAVAFVQADVANTSSEYKERQVLQAAYSNAPVVTFTTGLEIPVLDQIAVYPNPADRIVNIELPEPTKSGVEVKVFDQLGRPVLNGNIGAGQQSTTIDISGLASTLYLVQMKENGVSTMRRLLVTHKH
jgi:hypothetical protein